MSKTKSFLVEDISSIKKCLYFYLAVYFFKNQKNVNTAKIRMSICQELSRLSTSMTIRSCLDNVVNAHVRFAAEIPLAGSGSQPLTINHRDGVDSAGRRGASSPPLNR